VDTPLQNPTNVVGAIGMTGWVVDDVGVQSVQIDRNCLSFDPALDGAVVNGVNLVSLGDATMVAGAGPHHHRSAGDQRCARVARREAREYGR